MNPMENQVSGLIKYVSSKLNLQQCSLPLSTGHLRYLQSACFYAIAATKISMQRRAGLLPCLCDGFFLLWFLSDSGYVQEVLKIFALITAGVTRPAFSTVRCFWRLEPYLLFFL